MINPIIKAETVLRIPGTGESFTIKEHLATGGQGSVYRVRMSDGSERALKWYLPVAADAAQRRQLEKLIQAGPPSDRFLWPTHIITSSEVSGFGYLMALRPKGFYNITELMQGRIDPSFRALTRAGMLLADAFLSLHARGLCYGDISFGNVFLNPENGDIRICDNDNVVIDQGAQMAVLGTMRFMAPEIVRGQATPSSDTDRYSLAVLLFYLLMIHHPLEGRREYQIRCMDLPAMEQLYGHDPLFIFDPTNHDNTAIAGVHDRVLLYWNLYPESIRALFTQSFTSGLHDPREGRVRESEWRRALSILHDSVLPCTCAADNFYDMHRLKSPAQNLGNCWSCGKLLSPPARMRLGTHVMVLAPGAELYLYHLKKFPDDCQNVVCARVVSKKTNGSSAQTLGLENLSGQTWSLTTAEHTTRSLRPGDTIALQNDMHIHFGDVSGRIRLP